MYDSEFWRGQGPVAWVQDFLQARRLRRVDDQWRYWWYIEIECRRDAVLDVIRPHSRLLCGDCGRYWKRWWRPVDHSRCDNLPF